MRDYAFDQGFADEPKRLSAMESLWDPGSEALLVELGVGAGWRCLEVGAGGGSSPTSQTQASPMFEAKGAHACSPHAIRGLISSDCPSRV